MKFLSLIFIMLFSFSARSSLWVADNQWNESWEAKYSDWISKQVKPTFFVENQISTDCADAVISLRWIFSKINSLPAASSSGSGLITNMSSKWDVLSTSSDWTSDQRFLAALKSVNDSTDTKSLFRDVYPVELNVKNLKPGAMFVEATSTTGHAQWISQVHFDGVSNPIMYYSSTVPKMIRETLVYPFMKTKWPEQNKNGFVRFRWAIQSSGQVKLQSSESMPGYSLEQYKLALKFSENYNFDDFVTERLVGQPLEALRKLQSLAGHLAQRIENRVPVVVSGYAACAPNKCNKDSEKFYNYSTYSRDGAIQFLIIGITELIYSDVYIKNADDQVAGQMLLKWSQLQSNIKINLGFKDIEMGYIVANWNQNLFSSDPNDSIERRWGF